MIRAADDVDAIYAAIQRVRDESTPHCPLDGSRTLYVCLRSIARCGADCPYRDEWVGPDQ